MNNVGKLTFGVLTTLLLCLAWTPAVLAKPEPGACVEMGALVWNDWTSTDAGGSGMPAGETVRDYVRCKSCHGWDRLGLNGGYVRRTRTAERPNAGLGDSNMVSRDIAPGMGDYYHIRADEVLHTGIGRAFEDGSGSWVELGVNPSPAEIAAYAAGYTLGNLHPDFSTTGANAGDTVLTQEQLDCVVAFVNFGDSDPKYYFDYINTDKNPAEYIINEGARIAEGEIFYQQSCLSCHGDPFTDHNGDNGGKPAGGILAFLRADGKYSEFVHKARWGIPDTTMTRAAIGAPDSQNMLDVMQYLQELNETNFFSVGGEVIGLTGSGLVLQNNAGDDLAIDANGSFTFPTALADGSAYTVTVKTQPSNPSQTCSVVNGSGTLSGVDVSNIQVSCFEFWINAGLNDAWYNQATDGQGFFITVFPTTGVVFLSWFTYDTVRPAPDVTANLGEPGHRWLNAQGYFFGNQAMLDITIASGGLFDTATAINRVTDGTIILTLTDCAHGTVEYDIPSIGLSGVVPITRINGDNVPLCQTLEEQVAIQQSNITQKSDAGDNAMSSAPIAVIEAPMLHDMNPGLNDAWYNPLTDGQGFFINVFPEMEAVLLSWFTYDTVRPDGSVTANLGEPGHRWFNAMGSFVGTRSVMDISIASGGLFDTPTEITRTNDGTITLTFADCENGTVEYDIPSIDQSGTVPIQRIVGDNIALCEELLGQ